MISVIIVIPCKRDDPTGDPFVVGSHQNVIELGFPVRVSVHNLDTPQHIAILKFCVCVFFAWQEIPSRPHRKGNTLIALMAKIPVSGPKIAQLCAQGADAFR